MQASRRLVAIREVMGLEVKAIAIVVDAETWTERMLVFALARMMASTATVLEVEEVETAVLELAVDA